MHSDCITCGHHWSSHREHDGWRCQHSTGVMSARVNCGCTDYVTDETNTTEEQFDQMWTEGQAIALGETTSIDLTTSATTAQVIEVSDSTEPPVFVYHGLMEATLANGADA